MSRSEFEALSPQDLRDILEAWREKYIRDRDLADWRAGTICKAILEPQRDTDAMPRPFTQADFFSNLEKYIEDTSPTTEEELLAKFEAIIAASGGKIEEKG